MTEKLKKVASVLSCVVLSMTIAYLIIVNVASMVIINGSSMEPTLSDAQVALMMKYDLENIERNDIVVIDCKELNHLIIKRVIGLPNETVRFENDKVYINGEELQDDHGFYDTSIVYFEKEGKDIKLGPDEYFVMGDNRNHSHDSRTLNEPIKKEQIIAKDVYRFLPINRIGAVD